MSNPKVEVRTFKQQGGESLKDAWYRISNAHHRCTKKHSTMILLRNFYVGISSWNSYVLDTLAGGNFLGTPALEACTLIESLVGVLIRLKRIYNFLCSMLVYTPSALCFVTLHLVLMHFPELT
jgi:hypothetical protein